MDERKLEMSQGGPSIGNGRRQTREERNLRTAKLGKVLALLSNDELIFYKEILELVYALYELSI